MDESALKALIDSLNASRSSLDSWLTFWTWLVVVGVVFELVTVIREYLELKHAWYTARSRAVILPPERPSRPWLVFDLLAVILVVAGVAGELKIEAQIAKKETDLRNANGRLILLLDQKAGDAETSAQNAKTAAEDANATAGNAKTEVTQAQTSAADVGKKAEQVNQALGMAQFFLSDRDIRDPDVLKAKLSQFAGKNILFRSYLNDGDGYFLCKELDWLAGSAGVIATDQCGLFPVEPPHPMTQTNVFASDEESMLSLESVLSGATAFGASGAVANTRPAFAIVFVGRKNRVFVGETAQTRDAQRRAKASTPTAKH